MNNPFEGWSVQRRAALPVNTFSVRGEDGEVLDSCARWSNAIDRAARIACRDGVVTFATDDADGTSIRMELAHE